MAHRYERIRYAGRWLNTCKKNHQRVWFGAADCPACFERELALVETVVPTTSEFLQVRHYPHIKLTEKGMA